MSARAAGLALMLAMGGGGAWAAEPASAPDANLFVYRDAVSPAACAAELLLDGREFASLPQHSYTSLTVRPGVHRLEFRWASGCGHGDVTDEIDVQDRRLYYFALGGDARVTHDPLDVTYATRLHETTSLIRVDPDSGVQTVAACCRFVPARF